MSDVADSDAKMSVSARHTRIVEIKGSLITIHYSFNTGLIHLGEHVVCSSFCISERNTYIALSFIRIDIHIQILSAYHTTHRLS